MTDGKPKLDIAVLVVNGKNAVYENHLWIELCINKIIRFASNRESLRIFLWNHDLHYQGRIKRLVQKRSPYVHLYSEENESVKGLDSPSKRWRENSPLDWHGFHAHRTGLQLLAWKALDEYDPTHFVTFDSDSWPVKSGWDTFFIEKLQSHKLIGVWRDELKEGISPFVHPSGLGIAVSTMKEFGLRFDTWPANVREDSLSHISRIIHSKFGKNSICRLKRSNAVNIHPIFAGVYGDWIYHHHQGTRFTNNMIPLFKGSKERGESLVVNETALQSTTHLVFNNYDEYIKELRGI